MPPRDGAVQQPGGHDGDRERPLRGVGLVADDVRDLDVRTVAELEHGEAPGAVGSSSQYEGHAHPLVVGLLRDCGSCSAVLGESVSTTSSGATGRFFGVRST
jgi:hypothetical protein